MEEPPCEEGSPWSFPLIQLWDREIGGLEGVLHNSWACLESVLWRKDVKVTSMKVLMVVTDWVDINRQCCAFRFVNIFLLFVYHYL